MVKKNKKTDTASVVDAPKKTEEVAAPAPAEQRTPSGGRRTA